MKNNQNKKTFFAIIPLSVVLTVILTILFLNNDFLGKNQIFEKKEDGKIIEYLKAENDMEIYQDQAIDELKEKIDSLTNSLSMSEAEIESLKQDIQSLQKKMENYNLNTSSLRVAYVLFDMQDLAQNGKKFNYLKS